MNIHEYQAKEIFKRYGIPVNQSATASTPEEARKVAESLPAKERLYAVKAQVHAGGRGKGGGIKVVRTPDEVQKAAAEILGKGKLVTPQTGPEGKPVDRLLIEDTVEIAREYYASIVLDRSACDLCLIVSESGGMDIEDVAARTPERIIKHPFSPDAGLLPQDADRIAFILGLNAEHARIFSGVFQSLSKLFIEQDVSLVEINPLAVGVRKEVVAIDAKINFDENALFRRPEIARLRDPKQEDPREAEAKAFDLSYVGLNGNIGCIVNGAGLAMATLDIIQVAGGQPANFLDVGGGATKEKVAAAFKIILRDPKVKAILVNIFGGIMRCDVVAEGILSAVQEVAVNVPLVVRLEGTNVKEGKALLKQSSLKIMTAETFREAAEKVVAQV